MEISQTLVPNCKRRGRAGCLEPGLGWEQLQAGWEGASAREWSRSPRVSHSESIWSWGATRKQWVGSGLGRGQRRELREAAGIIEPWGPRFASGVLMRFKQRPKDQEG